MVLKQIQTFKKTYISDVGFGRIVLCVFPFICSIGVVVRIGLADDREQRRIRTQQVQPVVIVQALLKILQFVVDYKEIYENCLNNFFRFFVMKIKNINENRFKKKESQLFSNQSIEI